MDRAAQFITRWLRQGYIAGWCPAFRKRLIDTRYYDNRDKPGWWPNWQPRGFVQAANIRQQSFGHRNAITHGTQYLYSISNTNGMSTR